MSASSERGMLYLGNEYDLKKGKITDDPVLYKARHLTTHGVILGMTGSGKTGLGIILLEEILLQGLPVLILDPKGDIANLLLTFPELRPEDFQPWVDVEGAPMGSVITHDNPLFQVLVQGTAPIERLSIIQDGQEVFVESGAEGVNVATDAHGIGASAA